MARLTRGLAPEWLGLAAGAAALMVAHAAQYAGIVPCALCYLERWPYRVVVLLALAGLLWRRFRPCVAVLIMLSLLAAAALAWTHVGVEARWWKSPLPECAAPILLTGSIGNLLASMPAHPTKPCEDPTYLLPGLPVSMAQMNLAFALASAACVAICMRWTRTPP